MPRTKIVFICQSCGNESPRWVGRCPECNEWNTYAEKAVSPAAAAKKASLGTGTPVQELAHLSASSVPRLTLPMTEFNRVLGDGLFLLPETGLENIIERGNDIAPKLVIIDSIQTVYASDLPSTAGSIVQGREGTVRL